MRTLLIAALLAGVAAPALAARPDNDDRGERHRERSEQTESKPSSPRQERSVERPQQRNAEPRAESVRSSGDVNARNLNGHVRTNDGGNAQAVEPMRRRDAGDTARPSGERGQAVESQRNAERRNFEPKEIRAPRERSEVVQQERPSSDTVRNWRARERDGESASSIEERNVRRPPANGAGGLVQSKNPAPRVFDRDRRISRTPVRGTEPPPPRTATAIAAKPSRHWRTDWRHDHRYDWRNYRRHHRSHFRVGFYYDPFGWDYMQYGIGWRLWPSYYRSSFWLNDPWQYRLPPAYGPYRWIRYYNDALLVNIYTGEVVDVEYNFFW